MEPKSSPTAATTSLTDMLEPGEQVITTVRRHPIGILAAAASLAAIVIAVAILSFVVGPDFFGDSTTGATGGIVVIVTGLGALFLLAYTYIYRQSRLLITDRSLVQNIQRSLFIRKMSRLSMSDVEDVSAERRGLLSTIFGYGTLVVQTAGEKDNFIFPLCPTPERYADQIIEAREAFVGHDNRP